MTSIRANQVLLCSPRPAGFQRCNVAEQPCLPQLGKNDFALYPSISSFCLYDHGSLHAPQGGCGEVPRSGRAEDFEWLYCFLVCKYQNSKAHVLSFDSLLPYPPGVYRRSNTLRNVPLPWWKKYRFQSKISGVKQADNIPNVFIYRIVASFAQNVTIYLVWQLVYYELIVIRKKSKIATGERINSYSTMSKGKGPVANLLGKAPPKRREPAFMRMYTYSLYRGLSP